MNQYLLTLPRAQRVLDFLDSPFPDRPELQKRILQLSSRILGQHRFIESKLIPAGKFSRGLYGDMPGRDDGREEEEGGRFYEAVSKNTDLLLVRGVGYATNGGGLGSGDFADEGGDGVNTMNVEEYLLEVVGVSSTGIAELKRDHPALFQSSCEGRVKPAARYLSSMLSPLPQSKQRKLLVKMASKHPMLLQLDVESNLRPTALFLRYFFDLMDEELAAMIAATPMVLGFSVGRNLEPTMRFLRKIFENGLALRGGERYERMRRCGNAL
ncbi:hypothetical protein ACHAWF_002821 [Thalassiosira exigua]